ncbi:hypothetical protein DAMA08_033450 [Martiniozyma asiatica (nom. inval.)]|nr:hypothetical protein DAMA08_033450 [Martiniozyma asiatica]
MELNVHQGPVYACRFNNSGEFLASGGHDHKLVLWDMEELNEQLDEPNEIHPFVQPLHKSAITSIRWSQLENNIVFTSSADNTACAFDIVKGVKIKTFRHKECVNELDNGKRDTIVTVSDDGIGRIWDLRSKWPIAQVNTSYPLFTCCIDKNEEKIYWAGIDPTVNCLDLRKLASQTGEECLLWKESCQSNSLTSLSLSPDNNFLLSKSIDGSIKYFDTKIVDLGSNRKKSKPYVFDGPQSSDDDWLIRARFIPNTKDDELYTIASGSNDGFLFTWDFATRKLLDRKAGHRGAIFDVDYHLQRGKLATCSIDGSIILSNL